MANTENNDLEQEQTTQETEQQNQAAGTAAEQASDEKEEKKADKKSQKEDKKAQKAQKKADEDKLKEAEEKIASLEEKVAKEKDDYLRLMAEFDNYRRRTAQERLELIGNASADIIKDLLPIIDDFERALKALGESADSQSAKEGTELIYNKLTGLLKSKGVEPIKVDDNKQFNTDLHEAVAQFPVEDAALKGKIYDVVQTGYTLHGKVIRYAKVVVAI